MPALDCHTQRFLPWFGANTANAQHVGELLRGCRYVAVVFAGGMAELPHIDSREIVVNDKHKLSINLARSVADPITRRRLLNMLQWLPMCENVRERCVEILGHSGDDTERAAAYFVTQWMGRGGKAGTSAEFKGSVPIRTNANGGGTARRYWSAVRSLAEWGRVMRRCNFTTLDWKEFLDKYGGDDAWRGIYADPPWPDAGDEYLHTFTVADHRALAMYLGHYFSSRVVVRYGDHPLIRELYPQNRWRWHLMDGRTQANKAIAEVLLERRVA